MQYTLSTVSAIAALLSLTSAAPLPSAGASQEVIIVRQLADADSASTLAAKLDATTVNDNRKVKSATVSGVGPWCAGFTDTQAKYPAKALNGDGIFDFENSAVYAPEGSAIEIGSWWCGATRPEVENFVKNALANGKKDDSKNTPAPAEPINNGGNTDNDVAPVTVRVQIQQDVAGTTFTQEELPANVGIQSAAGVRGISRAADITIVSSNGDCSFIDAKNQAITFTGDELVDVVSFVCEAL